MFAQAHSAAPSPADPWLTIHEAAAETKTSTATLRRACKLRRLRHARVSGRKVIRIRRSWLDQWMEESAMPVEAVRT
jgi:excisionase family DNA binding protein